MQQEQRAFTVAAGRRAGLGDGRMRGPSFCAPFHGVRVEVSSDPESIAERALALAVRLPPYAVFSHATAAHLHGVPLPSRLERVERDLDICVFQPQRSPQLRGVRSHELKPTGQKVVSFEGLRLIAPEDAWVQLASEATVDDLVVAADWLITGDEPYSGTPGLTTIDRLDAAVARHGRMRGVKKLRMARDLARWGSLSPQETRLRLLMEASGFPPPSLNHRIIDSHGRTIAMVDLAYPDALVAIEYLGDHHRTEKKVYRDDIRRREVLGAIGWSVLFTTADDLADPALFLMNLRRALSSTGKTF